MDRYILEPRIPNLFHAGSKAREDINYFLETTGYKVIIFKVNDSRKFLLKVKNYLSCLLKMDNMLKEIGPDSVVLLQYPYPCRSIIFESIVNKMAGRGVKLVALVHDIDSLRMERPDNEIAREINYLNSFHHVISHNPIMTEWLKSKGLKKDVLDLGLFDYRMNISDGDTGYFTERTGDRIVVFAGNLSMNKSKFLYDFSGPMLKGIKMNLYGIEYDEKSIKCGNICFKGLYQPDELPGKMEGDYGLVWDGTDINTCSGHYGQYLRYNNPHKLSLYLAAGLPVITWKKAAISNMISQNKIGILVDSLAELSDAITEVSDEQYSQMRQNIRCFQEDVRNGHYIQSVVRKIEESFNKENNYEV